MKKVLCFGELLLRMSPVLQQHWLLHSFMPVYTGGAELNVAHALAKSQMAVKYCTTLPDNYLSHEIVTFLNDNGIELFFIIKQEQVTSPFEFAFAIFLIVIPVDNNNEYKPISLFRIIRRRSLTGI